MSKKTAGCLVFLLLAIAAKSQEVRYDNNSFVTTQVQAVGIFTTVLAPSPQALIYVCAHPANGVPCTNTVQTYTDITGAHTCPLTAQLTPYNGNTCLGTADVNGNFGFWIPPGTYDYTVCPQGQFTCLGPYPISVSPVTGGGGGTGGFGTVVPPGSTVQTVLNSVGTAGVGAPVVVPQGYTGSQKITNSPPIPILNYTTSPNGDYDKNGVQPVDIFGVRHDGLVVNCNVVAGNPQVACFGSPTPNFTSSDVGKLVILYNAGPSGSSFGGFVGGNSITTTGGSGGTNGIQALATTNGGCAYPMRGWITVSGGVPTGVVTLWKNGQGCTSLPTTATVSTVTGSVTLSNVIWSQTDLPTTIASVQNSTTFTATDTPTYSGGGEAIVYGTDDSAALTAACNGRGINQNGGHYTHVGISMISKGIVCDGNNTWIQGAGWSPLANSGGGSAIVYAGKNSGGTGTDGIWISSQGWGAKLTDMGLKGNSYARPRGLVISQGNTPHGNGNSASGEYDRLWIGWMWGDGAGTSSNVQIGEGIFADVSTGNGDFNDFADIHIQGAIHGIDGNNDQATAWTFRGNVQIESSYVGLCSFNGANFDLYYTEFNDTDIVLAPCVAGSGAGFTDIRVYGGESSAKNIVYGTLGAQPNSPFITIHSAGVGQPPQYEDPSNVVIDLSSTINTGVITLGDGIGQFSFGVTTGGERPAKIAMPSIYGGTFPPVLTFNGITATQLNTPSIGTDACGSVCGNRIGTTFTLNGNKIDSDPVDYAAIPAPWQQNDFIGMVRDFGSTQIKSPRPLGQTDYNISPIYGVALGTVGTPGSTTYNYEITCSDQFGNETAPAPTAVGGTTPNIFTITTGNATLSTTNYINISSLWQMRGCAYYNFYGDNGVGGTIGYLTTLTSLQYGANGDLFSDQGQYTKTTRVPPKTTQSGALTVDGPTNLKGGIGSPNTGLYAPEYCTKPGILDDSCITNAIAAVPSTGGIVSLGPNTYSLSNTITINKPVILQGAGSGYNCASPLGCTLVPPYLPATKLTWGGATSSAVLFVTPSGGNAAVNGVNLKDLTIEGAGISGVIGIDLNCMQFSTWQNVQIYNTSIGLQMGCRTGANTMINTFNHLDIGLAGTGIVMDGPADGACSTTCGDAFDNTFTQTHITYTGAAGIDIKSADNNQFHDLVTYRASGSNPGIIFESASGSGTTARLGGSYTYIYHYQPPPTNPITFNAGANVIHEYDIANGQAVPQWTGSHNAVYVTDGNHSSLITDTSGGFYLQDSNNADTTPRKGFTVNNGHLQIVGSNFSTVLMDIDDTGLTRIQNGTNTVYRCVTAGATLPVGSLTINAAACGTTADTGLRVP